MTYGNSVQSGIERTYDMDLRLTQLRCIQEMLILELIGINKVKEWNDKLSEMNTYQFIKNKLFYLEFCLVDEWNITHTFSDVDFLIEFHFTSNYHFYVMETLLILSRFLTNELFARLEKSIIDLPRKYIFGEEEQQQQQNENENSQENMNRHPIFDQVREEMLKYVRQVLKNELNGINIVTQMNQPLERLETFNYIRKKLAIMQYSIKDDWKCCANITNLNFVLEMHFEGKYHQYIVEVLEKFSRRIVAELNAKKLPIYVPPDVGFNQQQPN